MGLVLDAFLLILVVASFVLTYYNISDLAIFLALCGLCLCISKLFTDAIGGTNVPPPDED